MNILLLVSDTFRWDHAGFSGEGRARTPCLDRLAAGSVVFERAYCASFPTLPCRAELFTGRFVFPYLNWGPLPAGEVLLSDTLAAAGYTCATVTDNFALCRSGYGYDRGFHDRIQVRGQWYDNFRPPDTPVRWPAARAKFGTREVHRVEQHLRNTAGRDGEETYFAPQVITRSMEWLEHNRERPFFLYVDLFDPHEPWDPPEADVRAYDPEGTGEDVIFPAYTRAEDYSVEDLTRMRALYAGEVTMVDRWIGRLLDRLEALGLAEDTVVAFLSDHGIYLGERGRVGKMVKKPAVIGWPTLREIAQIPFLVRAPGTDPGRSRAFVHPGDLAPTLLELVGVPVPPTMKASSLVPILKGEAEGVRDCAVSSWSLRGWSAHRPSVVRTDEWALVFWRSGIKPELYHLPSDHEELLDVYGRCRSEAAFVHGRYLRFILENDAPLRNLVPRLVL